MLYDLTLSLPCAVCLFGTVWLLYRMKSNTRAQNILALCFLLSSVFFLCSATYIGGITDAATYMMLDIMDSFITLFVIPSMYLYFRALTDEGDFTWKDYIWFLPAFIVGIGTCVLYLAMDETMAIDYIKTILIDRMPNTEYTGTIYKLHYLISVQFFNITAFVQILGVGGCAVIGLRRYHKRIRKFHGQPDSRSLKVDNMIFLCFMLTIPFALGIIILKRTFWQLHPTLASFYYIGWAVLYSGLLYYGSRKKYSVENLAHDIQDADSKTTQ